MVTIIETSKYKLCNTNNHFEYFPIKITEKITIDKFWYQNLLPETQNNIKLISPDFVLDDFDYPHDNYSKLNDVQKDLWYNFYHCYLQQFNYSKYASFYKKDCSIVPISRQNLLILRDVAKVKSTYNPSMSWIEDKFDDLTNEFKNNIKNGLKKYDNECFIKTDKTSAKNEIRLEPKYTTTDVLNHISSCSQYYREYDYLLTKFKLDVSHNLIIMKWIDDFDEDREFRVIILNKKVKGISQQKWFKKLNHTNQELEKIGLAIVNFFTINGFYCKDITVDLIVDKDYNVNLIECNPGGLYSSSGSSLFHWIDDKDMLYDESDTVYIKKLV